MKRFTNNTSLYAEVEPEVHALVCKAANDEEVTLKKWLNDAIMEKLKRDNERV